MSPHVPIDDRQLDGESLRLLRAYTAEYRRSKHYRGLRFTVSLVLAAAGPLVSLWSLPAAGVVAAAAGAWVLVTRLLLIPGEQRRARCAVRIQERFDTRLFDLPWQASLAGPKPIEEDIADAARRVQHDDRVTAQHGEGWYPSTAALPWPVDVLVAQWSSAVYARRQHRTYAWFVGFSEGVIVIAAVLFGVSTEMLLTDWIITFLLPSLPALLDITELAMAHYRLAKAKEYIEERIDNLWGAELLRPGSLSADDCRVVQDEAFKLRADGVQVPDWFYWFHRDRNEGNMHEAAAVHCDQYKAATVAQAN